MGLIELLLGLGLLSMGAPFAGRLALLGYGQFQRQLDLLRASEPQQPTDVQKDRAAELSALIHREEVAKQTGRAIAAEAALAVTGATIERALATGDLNLAKDAVQIALPSGEERGSRPTRFRNQQNEQLQNLSQLQNQSPWVDVSAQDPFRTQASEFYLNLLRSVGQSHGVTSGSVERNDAAAVDGELLPPE